MYLRRRNFFTRPITLRCKRWNKLCSSYVCAFQRDCAMIFMTGGAKKKPHIDNSYGELLHCQRQHVSLCSALLISQTSSDHVSSYSGGTRALSVISCIVEYLINVLVNLEPGSTYVVSIIITWKIAPCPKCLISFLTHSCMPQNSFFCQSISSLGNAKSVHCHCVTCCEHE